MNDALKRTFEEHKEEYLQHLKNLISCDTQVLGHGIAGGREKAGQEYLEKLLPVFLKVYQFQSLDTIFQPLQDQYQISVSTLFLFHFYLYFLFQK